jgi:hypothetical protein
MDWGIIIAFGSLMFVVIGEILRAHMLIRRLEKRVKELEHSSLEEKK